MNPQLEMEYRKISLNPDAFDSLSYPDESRIEDQGIVETLFNKVKNDLVEELIDEPKND